MPQLSGTVNHKSSINTSSSILWQNPVALSTSSQSSPNPLLDSSEKGHASVGKSPKDERSNIGVQPYYFSSNDSTIEFDATIDFSNFAKNNSLVSLSSNETKSSVNTGVFGDYSVKRSRLSSPSKGLARFRRNMRSTDAEDSSKNKEERHAKTTEKITEKRRNSLDLTDNMDKDSSLRNDMQLEDDSMTADFSMLREVVADLDSENDSTRRLSQYKGTNNKRRRSSMISTDSRRMTADTFEIRDLLELRDEILNDSPSSSEKTRSKHSKISTSLIAIDEGTTEDSSIHDADDSNISKHSNIFSENKTVNGNTDLSEKDNLSATQRDHIDGNLEVYNTIENIETKMVLPTVFEGKAELVNKGENDMHLKQVVHFTDAFKSQEVANKFDSPESRDRQYFSMPRSTERSKISTPKSILNSNKKRKRSSANPNTISSKVVFSSPTAAEFNIGSPSVNLTPMPQKQAREMFQVPLDRKDEVFPGEETPTDRLNCAEEVSDESSKNAKNPDREMDESSDHDSFFNSKRNSDTNLEKSTAEFDLSMDHVTQLSNYSKSSFIDDSISKKTNEETVELENNVEDLLNITKTTDSDVSELSVSNIKKSDEEVSHSSHSKKCLPNQSKRVYSGEKDNSSNLMTINSTSPNVKSENLVSPALSRKLEFEHAVEQSKEEQLTDKSNTVELETNVNLFLEKFSSNTNEYNIDYSSVNGTPKSPKKSHRLDKMHEGGLIKVSNDNTTLSMNTTMTNKSHTIELEGNINLLVETANRQHVESPSLFSLNENSKTIAVENDSGDAETSIQKSAVEPLDTLQLEGNMKNLLNAMGKNEESIHSSEPTETLPLVSNMNQVITEIETQSERSHLQPTETLPLEANMNQLVQTLGAQSKVSSHEDHTENSLFNTDVDHSLELSYNLSTTGEIFFKESSVVNDSSTYASNNEKNKMEHTLTLESNIKDLINKVGVDSKNLAGKFEQEATVAQSQKKNESMKKSQTEMSIESQRVSLTPNSILNLSIEAQTQDIQDSGGVSIDHNDRVYLVPESISSQSKSENFKEKIDLTFGELKSVSKLFLKEKLLTAKSPDTLVKGIDNIDEVCKISSFVDNVVDFLLNVCEHLESSSENMPSEDATLPLTDFARLVEVEIHDKHVFHLQRMLRGTDVSDDIDHACKSVQKQLELLATDVRNFVWKEYEQWESQVLQALINSIINLVEGIGDDEKAIDRHLVLVDDVHKSIALMTGRAAKRARRKSLNRRKVGPSINYAPVTVSFC